MTSEPGSPAPRRFSLQSASLRLRSPGWERTLLVGAALWLGAVVTTAITRDIVLVPSVILLGSFLAPVTIAAYELEHLQGSHLSALDIVRAFVVGGVIGMLAAALIETYLLGTGPLKYFGVGLVEEGTKAIALMVVARHVATRNTRTGLLLGAALGCGFAAFESAGYAFNVLISNAQAPLEPMLETQMLRGVLTPFGHALWTAILGAVLFQAAGRNRRPGEFPHWRITFPVIGTYLLVSVLHGLWDSMQGIAMGLALVLTGNQWNPSIPVRTYLAQATNLQAHLTALFDWTGLVIISAVALFVLHLLRRKARAEVPHPREHGRASAVYGHSPTHTRSHLR